MAASSGPDECLVFGARRERVNDTGRNLLQPDWLRFALCKRQLRLHASMGCRFYALSHAWYQRELSIQRQINIHRLCRKRILALGKREQRAKLGRPSSIQSNVSYHLERDGAGWATSVQYGPGILAVPF